MTGRGSLRRGDGFGRAGDHDLPSPISAFRPEVDDPVGGLDHVEVVLDDDHRVARVDQAVENLEQLLDVGKVQAGRRLVEQVNSLAGGAP